MWRHSNAAELRAALSEQEAKEGFGWWLMGSGTSQRTIMIKHS